MLQNMAGRKSTGYADHARIGIGQTNLMLHLHLLLTNLMIQLMLHLPLLLTNLTHLTHSRDLLM